MTDERAVRLALDAAHHKLEADQLRNRLRNLAAQLDAAAEAAWNLASPDASGLHTAARIVRDQLERRPT